MPYKNSGLSPRGRGNLGRPARARAARGSIPAWAGKPVVRAAQLQYLKVYPRVGGETIRPNDDTDELLGLSPRGRGNPQPPVVGTQRDGSIPAWAGKPLRSDSRRQPPWVYPRVGGETRTIAATRPVLPGLSPRGRGNPPGSGAPGRASRSIPAWAGKPRSVRAPLCRPQVYPRVGGETENI